MKKSLISLMAIATALFVSSCAKEVLTPSAEGNEATVTFTIGLEDVVATRAEISDGSGCNELVYEVYDAEGTKIDALSTKKSPAFENALEETVTITLAKGQTYSFAFWAQNSACKAYTTTDLQRVEISYEGAANDETRDAFFGNTEDITVTGNFGHNVTLKRPFAQLNLAISDLEDAVKAGIALEQVKVVVSEVAANLNAKTGAVSGAKGDVEFSLANVLEQELTLTNGEKYPWVAMNYFLVNDETTGAASATADLTFTLTTDKSDIVLASSNTPVQRNWRTNIIAKLTSVGTFNIVIDPIFDAERDIFIDEENNKTPEVTVYGVKAGEKYYQTLAEAINAGATDIDLAAGEYTLDVNFSHDVTITGADKEGVKVSVPKSIYGNNFTNSLTLKNLTMDVPTGLAYNESAFAFVHRVKNFTMVDCKSNGRIRLNVENGLIDNCEFNMDVNSGFDGYAIYYYGGNNSNVKVSNSTFNTAGKAIVLYNESATVLNLDVENCTFVSSDPTTDKAAIQMHTEHGITGTVNIKNSTATGFLNVNNGLWNCINNTNPPVVTNNFTVNVELADGVSQVNGEYLISNAAGMYWFANQVNVNGNSFAGKTVKLTADIDLENDLWSPIGQTGQKQIFFGTFDGNGKTISNLNVDERSDNSTYRGAGLFGWFEGNGPVVKNLTIDGAEIYGHHYAAAVIAYCEEGGVIENVTVKNAKVHCVFNTVTEDDGDKAAAIVGYLRGSVNNCHAYDCEIDAVRDAGQIAGASEPTFVTNCTATNVTVTHNDSAAGYDYSKDGWRIAERLIGYDTTRNDNH